jgi:uncharacterized protein YfdQ (DUF2303 family)
MMDKTAIEQIQEAKQIAQASAAIHEAIGAYGKPTVALPGSYTLHDMEKCTQFRYRLRGTLRTECTSDFHAYAIQYGSDESSACFIDAESMRAQVIFNLGDANNPGHCDHTANLTLTQSAAYKALSGIINERKTQQDIAEFIEDWRAFINCYGEQDEEGNRAIKPLVKALHAVRNITIEAKTQGGSEERTFGNTKSMIESIDVAGSNLPPEIITFSCEPYKGLPSRDFDLRLSVIKSREPYLVLRIIRHEEHKEQMAKEFQKIVEAGFASNGTNIPTYIGDFKP